MRPVGAIIERAPWVADGLGCKPSFGFRDDPAAPFGGVKVSCLGRELGPEGLTAYPQVQSIYGAPLPQATAVSQRNGIALSGSTTDVAPELRAFVERFRAVLIVGLSAPVQNSPPFAG
jgi:hypothetical protein